MAGRPYCTCYKEEAMKETLEIVEIYRTLFEEYLAIPTIIGRKSNLERFAGADETFSIETMMRDKKALQAGTSHYLGTILDQHLM